MRLILFSILILSMCSLGAETVYKTVDENGNVIFTDKPSEEAEEINIQELETIKNPHLGRYSPSTKQPKVKDAYESITVTQPESGSAVRSNNGKVSISVSTEPPLQSGHKIIISMDGKEVASSSSASLQNVDRGTHNISASVVDGSGKKLISTSSAFSLLRASQ